MADVTFKLNDAGVASMANLFPRVSIIPEGPAVLPTSPVDYFIPSKPVAAVLAPDGVTFSATLFPSSWTQPRTLYRLVVEWLDSAGNFKDQDAPPWRFNVPPEGGSLSDMLEAPLDGGFVWVTASPDVPPHAKPGDLVYNPDTDDLDQVV